MSDRLPQVELNESTPSETEPWPEWREPPIEVTDALKQAQPNPYDVAPAVHGPYGTEHKSAAVEPSATKPPRKLKRQRSSDAGDNLRAVVAQLSIILPFVGPMIAFAMSPNGSPARRSAAKAFNGQALAALSLVGVAGAAVMAEQVTYGWDEGVIVLGTIGVLGGWLLQSLIATVAAATGHDWTSPLTRILRLRLLPEDDAEDSRG